jgi:pimeloyl-ACP methyl ester carboxylesterase
VSPPDDLLVYFSHYLDLVTGSDDLLDDLVRLMEERFGERAEEFEFRRLVETLDQPLLVLHAADDEDVPIEAGRFVASHWPAARMVELDGLGHRRILRDPGAIQAAATFLAE